MIQTIGIVGCGVVGKATARAFMEWAEVRCYDDIPERATHTLDEVMVCDLIFICLPTPQRPNSLRCNMSTIEEFFIRMKDYDRDRSFVLRSTVPIGTTTRLAKEYSLHNLVHSPEFLTARCSLVDAQIPSRNVIGIPNADGRFCQMCANGLHDLYLARFAGVPCFLTTSDDSEAIKLFTNGFFAVKVAYFNEIYSLAEKLGLNWQTILAGMLSDGRIAHSHTQVPGPDGKRGFGGACLPKDLANLIQCLKDAGCEDYMTNSARNRNTDFDRKEE